MPKPLALVFYILLALATALLVCACARSDKTEAGSDSINTVTVAVAPATREDLARDMELAAEFRPYQEIDVHAKVAGYLKEIYVDVGDRVRKGQVLAVLEIPELADELKRASASKQRSDAELLRAREELARSESAHTIAHLTADRLAGVLKTRPNLLAQQEIDEALARDRVAEAQVSAAKAALAATEFGSHANAGHVRLCPAHTRPQTQCLGRASSSRIRA
jgi:multidrug efflux pump subunit AcrA (membrane-fusion protein)